MSTEKSYLSLTEAANIFGTHRQTISNYIKKGYFKCNIVGKSYMIDKDSFNKFMRNCSSEIKDIEEITLSLNKELDAIESEQGALIEFRRSIKSIDLIGFINDIFDVIIEEHPYTRDREIAYQYLDGVTLQQIAKNFDLTVSYVSQILQKTIRVGKHRFAARMRRMKYMEQEISALKNEKSILSAEILLLKQNKTEDEIAHIDDYTKCFLEEELSLFDFSARALRCFKSAEINNIAELLEFDPNVLLRFPNFGRKTLMEIKDFLIEHDLLKYSDKWKKYFNQ